MESTKASYFRYWGKAKKPLEIDYCEGQLSFEEIKARHPQIKTPEQLQELAVKNRWQKGKLGARYHLLAFHSLDVAATGKLILERNLFNTDRAIAKLTDNRQGFIDFFTFLLALHDLGKFASAFQAVHERASDDLGRDNQGKQYTVRHDSLGYCIWSEAFGECSLADMVLGDDFDLLVDGMETLIKVVTGHHGAPPLEMSNSLSIEPGQFFSDEDAHATLEFVQGCKQLLLPEWPKWLGDWQLLSVVKELSWLFAGVTMLVDWLGSNQYIFRYRSEPLSLADYWEDYAKPRAEKTLSNAGLDKKAQINPFQSIKALFGFSEGTPLQKYCEDCPLDKGPQLFLLEDITGAGKTEAALILAQRLLSAQVGSGIYVALPTMATSNAMFDRMADVYQKFFASDPKPSVVLAHGARHLNKNFTDIIDLSKHAKDAAYSDEEESASGWCNYWFVDNRKKSLLADVGVGTVDQALLSVLPSRHQAMRLLGVSNKILVVDEVHSYSTYESKLIQALVKFHASLGGTTILLSATMPFLLRQALVKAYAEGVGVQSPALKPDAAFPWFTQLGQNQGIIEQPIESRKSVSRTVDVEYVTDQEQVWQLIETALKQKP